jgi:hypothetical protein
MTDAGPYGFDADKERIRVAIQAYFAHPQNVAAGFALFPELVSRAAEKNNFAGALRFRERFCIHEAKHQYIVTARVLNDGRHQRAALLKVDIHVPTSRKSRGKNKNPAGASRASGLMSACLANRYAHLSGRGA